MRLDMEARLREGRLECARLDMEARGSTWRPVRLDMEARGSTWRPDMLARLDCTRLDCKRLNMEACEARHAS
jgi:hypothetical protein